MAFDWKYIKNLFAALKDLTAIGSANVIATIISGIFWFYMASLIGTEQYGKISYLYAIANITSTIAFFGASNTVITYTAKEQKIQTSVYFLVIILSIAASLIVFFVVNNIGVSLYVIGAAIFALVIAEHLGRKLYKNYSKYVISQRVLSAGLAVGLYFLMGPDGIILGFALSYFPYLVKLYNGFRESKIELSAIRLRLGFMTNSYAMELTNILVQTADKLIVYPLFGFALLGNYQLGMQFLTLLTVLPASVYQYILPREASGISNKKLVKATILVSIALAVIGVFLVPKIILFLFPKFKEVVEIVQIMSLAIIPTSINAIYASKFFALERSKVVLTASISSLSIMILTIFILGKIYGINGAAVGPVLGAACTSIYYIIASKIIKEKFR